MQELVSEFNFKMGVYQAELKRAMNYLSANSKVIFLGQAVAFPGTAMTTTLEDIDKNKLIEMPVEEDLQMGVATGMAMHGLVPVSIFPRWNFMLLAVNQIVNHLDKLQELLNVKVPPKVIIRTGIGSLKPLDPGPQHKGDYTTAFKAMCNKIEIVRLDSSDMIFPSYKRALEREDGISTIIVEWSDKYYE
jgi:pyruvate/2-oxoglutarate/acetoin dehydrogenase E1 component